MQFRSLLFYTVSFIGFFLTLMLFWALFNLKRIIKNPKPKKFPSVTVIVPAYNEENTLIKTLDSLLNLNYPKNLLKIVVVDDGSTDNTLKVANSYKKKGVVIYTKPNSGKGESLNFAIKKCKTDIVGALDADSFVDPDALREMVGYFNNKNVAAVTPSMLIDKPNSFLLKVQSIELILGIFMRKAFAALDSIHVTPGPFTMFRREIFEKHGFYAEDNITEDIEIALRIQTLGYSIENSITARVYTKTPSSFKPLLVQRIRWYRGFLDNIIDYKNLFSKNKGNLGIIILPSALISIVTSIVVFSYVIFNFFNNLYKNIVNLSIINFDFMTLLNFEFDLFYRNTDPIAFFGILGFFMGFMTVWLGNYLSYERKPIFINYVFFVISYWALFPFWWVVAIYYKITGKKIKWGKRYL